MSEPTQPTALMIPFPQQRLVRQSEPQPDFWDTLYRLRSTGSLCDIHLSVAAKGGNVDAISFPAHKVVLVASSRYFQKCLAQNELLDVFNFDGITAENLQIVLDYMYHRIHWDTLQGNPEARSAATILEVIRHDTEHQPSSKYRRQKRLILSKDELEVILPKKKPGKPDGSIAAQPPPVTHMVGDGVDGTMARPADGDRGLPVLLKIEPVEDSPAMQEQVGEETAELLVLAAEEEDAGHGLVWKLLTESGRLHPGTIEELEHPVAIEPADSQHAQSQSIGSAPEPEAIGAQPKLEAIGNEPEMEISGTEPEAEAIGTELATEVTTIEPEIGVVGTMPETDAVGTVPETQDVGTLPETEDVGTMPETEAVGTMPENESAETELETMTELGTEIQQSSNPTDIPGKSIRTNTFTPEPRRSQRTRGEGSKVAETLAMSKKAKIVELTPRRMSTRGTSDGSSPPPAISTRMSTRHLKVKEEVQQTPTMKTEDLTPRRSSRRAVGKKPGRYGQDEWVIGKEPKLKVCMTHIAAHTIDVKSQEKKGTPPDDITGNGDITENNDITTEKSAGDDDVTQNEHEDMITEPSLDQSPDEQEAELDHMQDNHSADDLPLVIKEEPEEASRIALRNELYQKLQRVKNKNLTADGLQCQYCKKMFKNITGLSNHTMWHHSDKKIDRDGWMEQECKHCKKVLRSSTALLTHERKAHKIFRDFPCEHCDFTCPSNKKLKVHMLDAHKLGFLTCDVCGDEFRTREGHRIHMFKQHSTEAPKEMCETCGKVFKRHAELRNHMKFTHTEDRNCKCMLCSRSFKCNTTLRRHLRTYHSDVREHECDLCPAHFKTRSDLGAHRNRHFRKEMPLPCGDKKKEGMLKTFECSQCKKTFKRKAHCQLHFRMQHIDKQSGILYKCGACGKSFEHKTYLVAHINQCHCPKRFSCPKCQAEFSHRYLLKRHTNLGRCKGYPEVSKPYKCGRCDLSFTLKGNLTKHLADPRRCRVNIGPLEYMVVMEKDEDGMEALGQAAVIRQEEVVATHNITEVSPPPETSQEQMTFTVQEGQAEDIMVDDLGKSVIFVNEDGVQISSSEIPAFHQQLAAEFSDRNVVQEGAPMGITDAENVVMNTSGGQMVFQVMAPDGSTTEEVVTEVIEHC